MQLFVDTADAAVIRELAATGLVDGVTTNPSLMAKAGRDIFETLADICQATDGPVSAEVTATDAEGMVRQGLKLRTIASNIVVKAPLTWEGLKATRRLADDGHPVNVTLCFSAPQALLAAKAGAAFVSPFIGRLDDLGQDGMQLIADIRQIYDIHDYDTAILAASIRGPQHVTASALAGADAATIPPSVFQALAQHPLTDKGLAAFLADWAKTGQDLG